MLFSMLVHQLSQRYMHVWERILGCTSGCSIGHGRAALMPEAYLMRDSHCKEGACCHVTARWHILSYCAAFWSIRDESPRTAMEGFAAGTRSIADMVADIKRGAITKCRPVRAAHPPAENVCLVGQQSGRIKWIQPSGAHA